MFLRAWKLLNVLAWRLTKIVLLDKTNLVGVLRVDHPDRTIGRGPLGSASNAALAYDGPDVLRPQRDQGRKTAMGRQTVRRQATLRQSAETGKTDECMYRSSDPKVKS